VRTLAAIASALLLASCATPEQRLDDVPETMTLVSTAFEEGADIPVRFTCDGDDVSPPLRWTGVPDDAVELAVLVEDPGAPRGTFVHWVVAGIDPAAQGFEEGDVPHGAVEGSNDFGQEGYRGPCPPEGDEPHRYAFTVLALSKPSDFLSDGSAADLYEVAADTAVASGRLAATYGR
jgi:Raf kinase inhibitor-like YbhB/YbcL family protein